MKFQLGEPVVLFCKVDLTMAEYSILMRCPKSQVAANLAVKRFEMWFSYLSYDNKTAKQAPIIFATRTDHSIIHRFRQTEFD